MITCPTCAGEGQITTFTKIVQPPEPSPPIVTPEMIKRLKKLGIFFFKIIGSFLMIPFMITLFSLVSRFSMWMMNMPTSVDGKTHMAIIVMTMVGGIIGVIATIIALIASFSD